MAVQVAQFTPLACDAEERLKSVIILFKYQLWHRLAERKVLTQLSLWMGCRVVGKQVLYEQKCL
jgi:hypothetical protein